MTQHGRALPSGLVTFVFTDIEGSTRLLREHPDTYPAALRRHRALLHRAWTRYDGVEINTEGDGTLVVFADATAAVQACVEAQLLLSAERWPEGMQLRVRMGMHSGLAHPVEGDYVAMAVHQAARVASAGNGGQVLVSPDTAALAHPEGDVTLEALGLYRVRDFERAIVLYEARAPALAGARAAVRAQPAENHNYARVPTSFIGREKAVAEVLAAVGPGRLVTVLGPGGVGKSRLAEEVGLAAATQWPDGVWRVNVDDLPHGTDLTTTVAETLAIELETVDALHEVASGLMGRQMLIILDGCEHRLDEVSALVSAVLPASPDIGLLVTSREPLHVAGEEIYRLPPLRVGAVATAAAALEVPAVVLFVQRAKAVGAPITVTDDNARTISELVTMLDGLPLALEIAAGFAAVYSPEQMLAGLDENWQSLQSRDRSLPSRQRSLQALLEWSERALSAAERAALRRLSVFAGSFTLSAAREVVSGGEVAAGDVAAILLSLVDRSLVVADPTAGGTRYRTLSLVRRFASLRLDEADETDAYVLAATRWYHSLVGPERAGDRLWVGRVAADADNIRGLIPRALALSDPDATHLAGELAVSLVTYSDGVQAYQSGILEGGRWLSMLPASPERVSLRTAIAFVHLRLGEVERAEQLVRQAELERAEVGALAWDDVGIERTKGEIATRSGRPRESARIASHALEQPRSLRSRVRLLSQLGIASALAGDLAGAADAIDQELATAHELGDDLVIARSEGNAAEIALRRGLAAEAARHQRACLSLATTLGQPAYLAYSLIVAARLEPYDPAATVRLLTKAEDILKDSGHRLYAGDADEVARLLREAQRAMGDSAYRRARQDGHAVGIEQARQMADDALRRTSG